MNKKIDFSTLLLSLLSIGSLWANDAEVAVVDQNPAAAPKQDLSPAGNDGSSNGLTAWGSQPKKNGYDRQQKTAAASVHSPYNADQAGFTEATYLIMKLFQGDMAYTVFDSQLNPLSSPSIHSFKVKNPEYGWNSGVRAGIGAFMSGSDLWDVSLYGTYLYADAKQKRTANFELNQGVSALWTFANALGTFYIASVESRIQYYTADLTFRRAYKVMPTVVISPYIGVRSGFIYQDYNVNYNQVETPNSSALTDIRNNIDNNFWGVGARAGSNFSWNFEKNWSFLGNFSSSFLWGEQTVTQKIHQLTTSIFPDEIADNRYHYSNQDHPLRVSIEGSLGLGWQKWFNNQTVRVAPSLLFEGILWFGLNQIPQISSPSGSIPGSILSFKTTRHHGNLGIMGLSLNFQVDF